MTTTTHAQVVLRLRNWAQGVHYREAGVELLIRSGLCGHPLVADACDQGDGPELDAVRGALDDYRVSGGQRRLGLVALSLLGGQDHAVDLQDVVAGLDQGALDVGYVAPGLDRTSLDLVLTALSHAAVQTQQFGAAQGDDVGRVVVGWHGVFPAVPAP